MSEENPYFCEECKRNHTKGKIYKEHLQFANFSKVEHIDKVIEETELIEILWDEEEDLEEFDFEAISNIKDVTAKKEFKVNEYLTLKLEGGKTNIYVMGHHFNQCKFLMLDVPIDKPEKLDEIKSIDEAANILGWKNGTQPGARYKYKIDPHTEFWGHCSNLQAWYEHDYDTRLLHSNLSFPLLKKLARVGDPIAEQVFKSEIKKRLKTGISSVINFLKNEGYIYYVTEKYDYLKYGIEAVKKLPGVGESTLKKLIGAGLSNLKAIAFVPPRIIEEESGLGSRTVAKLIKASMAKLNITPRKASELWEERKKMRLLTTGSLTLDDLLGGGLEVGSLTEIFGEYRTGKTQLCHQLCVNIQLPYGQGGKRGNAYYIDTGNSFRSERIVQMAENLDLDYEEVLENIHVGRAYNSDHQILLVKELYHLIPEFNIELLVLDNIINWFLTDYNKKGSLEVLRDRLRSHLRDLQTLLDVFPNLIIVFTNQVKTNHDILHDSPLIALGGNVVAHASSTRIYVRKGKGEQRVAKMIHSPRLPEGEAVFSITENGISD